MKFNIKKRIIFLSIVIFLTMLALVYFILVPKLVNVEKYKPEVRKYLKENIAVPVQPGNLNIEMTWDLGVKIKTDNISVKKADGKNFISIGNSYIELALVPLLKKNVEIRRVVVNSLNGNIIRLKDGTFDIEKIFIKKVKPKYKVKFKNSSINLSNYKINFTDNYVLPSKNLIISGEIIDINNFTPSKHIEIEAKNLLYEINKHSTYLNLFVSAELPLNSNKPVKSKIKAFGNVINLNIKDVQTYINKYSPRKFSVLEGRSNAKFNIDLNTEIDGRRKFFIDSKTNDLNVVDAVKKVGLSHKGELIFVSSGNFDDRDLYLDNFHLSGNRLNTDIRGKISNFINKKIRNIDLKIDINNNGVKESAEVFPKFIKVPLDPFNKLLKYNADGSASGSIVAKGYYRRPDLFGKVKYSDFSIVNKYSDTPNGCGTVEFLGPTLVINSMQYFGKDEFVKTTGTVVPFKGKKIKLSVNSTQNVDFSRVLPVLLAVRDIFQFKLRPVTEMQIQGTGKANLDIEGALKDAKLTGYVEARNATVKYITLADKAEHVNGKIKFTGDKVYYDELTGFVNGIKIIPSGYTTLHGYSDMKLYMPNLDLKKGQKFVYGSPLLYKTQFVLRDIQDINGIADTTIFLKGDEIYLDSTGILKFANANIKYNGYAEPFNDLKGQLRYDMKYIYFDNINGNVLGNSVTINGFSEPLTKYADLTITSKKINLEEAKKFVMNSSLLYESQKILDDYTSVKGFASINLVLNGSKSSDVLQQLVFNNLNATFEHKNAGFPIKIDNGTLLITGDTVETQGITANAYNTDFFIKGKVFNIKANILNNAPLIPELTLKIKKLDASNLKSALKSPAIPVKYKKHLSKFSNMQGYVSVLAYIKPSGFTANIDFDNLSMVYLPKNLPLAFIKGKAEISDRSIYLNDLFSKISSSDLFIKGTVRNYLNNPSFQVMSLLKISPEDMSKLGPAFNQAADTGEHIPLSALIKGNINNWQLLSKITFNKGIILPYVSQIGIQEDAVKTLTLNAHGQMDRLDINSLKLDLLGKHYDYASENPWIFDVKDEKENIFDVSGSIENLSSDKPLFNNFRIKTNTEKPLSTCILNPCLKSVINNGSDKFFSDGNIRAELIMKGYILNPKIEGNIVFSNIKIPDYKINIANTYVNFTKDTINVDFKDFKMADSIMDVNAVLDYSMELPLVVRDININSSYINVDNIARIFVSNNNMSKADMEDFKTPSFIIKNGKLNAKELILRDLITSNVNADVIFTPDWLLSISDLKMNAAGGIETGNLYYNAKSSELSLSLNAKNIQANAIASTLLNLPNEVYGTLNGDGQLYTKGKNTEEMISNLNGYANFKVNDGRLVRLGSLEYFLRAANVLQSGIGGFNLNNIIDLVAPQKTGHFEYLEGGIDIKDGVLSTEGITSSGENLSLFISGDFDMLTNFAGVKVLGKLSKKVSGLLGPVGSVSINQFIGYIPGFGFLPATTDEKGLIDIIPGLSKIPVLGLEGTAKYRQFEVNINGNLYDTSSVKSFRWLDN